MKKYLVYGGYVYCDDGDEHYINAHRVAELYNIHPENCIFINKDEKHIMSGRMAGKNSLIKLSPRSDGNYDPKHLITNP